MAAGEYIASHTITYEYIIIDDPPHGLLRRMAAGEYIASHTITYEYIITDDPPHGLLVLISPWSGENSHGLYFSLL